MGPTERRCTVRAVLGRYSYPYGDEADNYHSWDIAYSETWGPPYDATSKLWDMTHGLAGWCSAEADAPAVSNMVSMDYSTFVTKVRSLSTTLDATARQALYTEVLTALHDEAIFLPLTSKQQTAVTSKGVSGFQFGYMEFDLPLANLYPSPASSPPAACEAGGGHDGHDHGGGSAAAYEWAGIFSTPMSSATWLAQKVDGDYADPTMRMRDARSNARARVRAFERA